MSALKPPVYGPIGGFTCVHWFDGSHQSGDHERRHRCETP